MKHIALTPNIYIDDMERSLRFYRDVLGLQLSQTVPPDKGPFIFAWMKAGESGLFLNTRASSEDPAIRQAKPNGSASLYLIVDGIEELLKKVQASGAKLVQPIKEQFYGMREFICLDPDGWMVIVAEEMKK